MNRMIFAAIGVSLTSLVALLMDRGALALLSLLFGVGFVVVQQAYVSVPDLAVAVVFNRERQGFSRLLPAGRHFLFPFVEEVNSIISVSTQTIQAVCASGQAIGGLPLRVEWSLSFQANPMRLTPTKQRQLAHKLGDKAPLIVTRHVNNSLQDILSEYRVDDLVGPGSQRRLERALRQRVRTRLSVYAIDVTTLMIGRIQLPASVLSALTAAHEEALHTERAARSLARLQRVVTQFSEADMRRLMELERIHMLGKNGVTLVYPANAALAGAVAMDAERNMEMIRQRIANNDVLVAGS